MLKELKQYDNLGTPKYFWELVQLLQKRDTWKLADVKLHFYNRIIDGKQIFDGCIPILEICGIIEVKEESKEVILDYPFTSLFSEQSCSNRLLESFLAELNQDADFHQIFKSSQYDYKEHRTIVVDGAAFGLKYVNAKKLLINFRFLIPHPQIPKKFLINSTWKKYVDKNISPRVRKVLSLEELQKKLRQQELNGEISEKYVLKFEKKRLDAKGGIHWVAPYDTGAGFDILSFHTKEDTEPRRFIEVKSYAGSTPYFYWSKNEIKVATDNAENYVLYLVDRNKINEADYKPEMIRDPIKNILNNQSWEKSVDTFFLRKISK